MTFSLGHLQVSYLEEVSIGCTPIDNDDIYQGRSHSAIDLEASLYRGSVAGCMCLCSIRNPSDDGLPKRWFQVVEESVYALGTYGEAFSILRQCRKYIDQEIRAPNNQLPPLEDGLALSVIRTEARRYRCDRILASSWHVEAHSCDTHAHMQRQRDACLSLCD